MSIRAMEWARKVVTGNPTLKAVLRAIADYADDHGYSWPSQLTLAADTELSERAVRDALKALELAGLLTRIPWRRPDNSRATDTILLVFDSHEAQNTLATRVPAGRAGTPADQSAPRAGSSAGVPAGTAGSTGRTCRRGYRQDAPGVPAAGAGLTTFEPPLNHQGFDGGDESGRTGSTEGGFSERDWQVNLERLVSAGHDRHAAKRFLGKCLRSLKGRETDLSEAVEQACASRTQDKYASILRKLDIGSSRRRFARVGANDILRNHNWPPDFREIFWASFVRKEDKIKAIKVLEHIQKNDDTSFDEILSGISRLVASGIEKRFVPHAHRWLRDKRWNDEIADRGVRSVKKAPAASSSSQDLWANDAISANLSRQRGKNDQGNDGNGQQSEPAVLNLWGGTPSTSSCGGADRISARQLGSEPEGFRALRVVGRL